MAKSKELCLVLNPNILIAQLNRTLTTYHLVHLIDTILNSHQETNIWWHLISVELKQAFESSWHNVLINKLLCNFQIE
jgi:hypothetical protein